MNARNLNYDLLRLTGLILIVIAHSSPPEWLFQLRNFGTPLLVVGSGLTYALIYSTRKMDWLAFYKKRIPKLVLPVWIFLTLFFSGYLLSSSWIGFEFPFSTITVAKSYALLGGIGFVWVFKIYLMLALITPIAISFCKRVTNTADCFLTLISCYVIYELFILYAPDTVIKALNPILLLLPYALLYLYAFKLSSLSDRQIIASALVSFIIFASIAAKLYAVQGNFVPTQEFKYPPTLYYLSYAFFATNLCFLMIKSIRFNNHLFRKSVTWCSSNSLWLYLWHIFAFYLWQEIGPNPNGDLLLFLIKTSFIVSTSVAIVALQNKVLPKIFYGQNIWQQKLLILLVTPTSQEPNTSKQPNLV